MTESSELLSPLEILALVEEVGTDMLSIHDASGTYLYASPSCERLFGWTPEQLVGLDAYALFHPEDVERIRADHRAHEDAERDQGLVRYRLRCADGSHRLAETRSRPKFEDGELRYIVCFTRDIHERYRLELEATRARSGLTSLGLVAASAAHELRNPLAYLVGNLEFVRAELAKAAHPPELTSALDDALVGADRVRDLSRQLLRFARPDDGSDDAARADLEAAVDAAVRMSLSHVRRRARLDVEWATDRRRVAGSQWRISQIVLNLLTNAADAMPPRPASDNCIELRVCDGAEREVLLEVRDNGRGLDEVTRRRVFEPLFSTKHRDRFGLGLWICRSLADALGATLELESRPGEGATFRLRLRAVGEAPDADVAPARSVARPARDLRIVIVDDEPMIGRALERSLRSLGSSVCVHAERRAALDCIEHEERVDVLISDLVMNDADGRELVEAADRLRPGLARRSVLMSGQEPDDEVRAFLERTGCAFLAKPFQTAELHALIGRLAGAP